MITLTLLIKIVLLVVVLAILSTAVIYYKVINYKSVSFFEKKLFELFYNIDLETKNISLVIGNNKLRRDLFERLYTSNGYKKIKIDNITNDGLIEYIQVALFDNQIVFNIVEYESSINNKSVYKVFLDLIYKYIKHKIVINNIILLFDDEIQTSNFTTTQKSTFELLSYIVEITNLTIPIYFVCNITLTSLTTFVDKLDSEIFTNCFGLSADSYKTGNIYFKNFTGQINLVLNNLTKLSLKMTMQNNIISDNIMLSTLKHDFETIMNTIVENICININRIINNNHIVFRQILFTGLYNVHGMMKYLFLNNFFSNTLYHESSLVYFDIKHLFTNRSKFVELILFLVSLCSFIYISIASALYLNNVDLIANKVESINHFMLQNTTRDTIYVEKIIRNTNAIHALYVNRSTFNIFYYLDEFFNNTKQKIFKHNNLSLNKSYLILKNFIVNIVQNQLDYRNLKNISIDDLSEVIKQQYDKFWLLVEKHNNIQSTQNIIKQINGLNDTMLDRESDNMEVYDKYQLCDYKVININDFNITLFSRGIVYNMLESIDVKHPIHDLYKLNSLALMLLTSYDTLKTINYLLELKSLVDDLQLQDIVASVELQECFQVLNKLKDINYVSSSEFSNLNNKIVEKVNKYRQALVKNENKLIGNVTRYNDGQLEYSDNVKNMYKYCSQIVNSDIYRRLIMHMENSPMQDNSRRQVISNLDGLTLVLNDYFNIEKSFENKYIDNEFKKILLRLVNTEINYTWHESVKSMNDIFDSESKYLNYMQQHFHAYYEKYQFVLHQASTRKFSCLLNHVNTFLTDYVNTVYESIVNYNTFKEQVIVLLQVDNYFGHIFNADSKELFLERIDESIKDLIKFIKLFDENIFLIRQYSSTILDNSLNNKIKFIYNLVQDVQEYEKDSENSLIGKLKEFIINTYTKDNKELTLIVPNKAMLKEKSYISDCYIKLVQKYNHNVLASRNKVILNDWNELKQICISNEHKFPVNMEGKSILTYDDLKNIIEKTLDIIDKAIEYSESENSKIYNSIITKLDAIQDLDILLENKIPLNINISLSSNLKSATYIKLKVLNAETGEQENIDINRNNSEVNFHINYNSNLELNIGPLLQNTINYKTFNDEFITIGDTVIINFPAPSYLSLIHKSVLQGYKLSSILEQEITIPLLLTEMSIDKAEYIKTPSYGTIKLKLFCNHKLITAIKEVNNILQNIIKDKII